MKKQFLIAILILNFLLTAVFYTISTQLPAFNFLTLEIGNTLLAALCLLSYLLVNKQISSRPQAFVRGVNSATLLKLMACMVAILVYVAFYRSHIHKPTIFVFMGTYIVYTAVETWVLFKLARVSK